MARGTQFLTLVTDLRAELRRSSSVAVGVDDIASLKRVLNRVYSTLALQYNWPHLSIFPTKTLVAGQRYYDLPSGLDTDRIIDVALEYSGTVQEMHRGIGFDEYSAYDSDEDERSEPALRWETRWTGSATQIEVWPIPNTATQKLRFKGVQATPRLVDDDDVCLLDDDLVILYAAAELLAAQKDEDAPLKLQAAQGHLEMLQARSKGGIKGRRMGLGSAHETNRGKVTVAVSS